MTSTVAICNGALVKVGARAIMALDDSSKEARLCKERFDGVRDEVLRDHPWNFALKRAQLAQLTEAPVFEFAYQYSLPADCLRVLRVNDGRHEYGVEGRKILTNDAPVNLLYVARVSDPSLYDSSFVNALSFRLAAELAYPLANSRTLVESLMDGYQQALQKARANDASEGTAQALYEDTFIEARF